MDRQKLRKQNKSLFIQGMRDGIPIGLGYLAVSFSLGITARNIGLNALQSFIVSLLCNASAGEYAGFTSIAANASYMEIAMITFIANARYLLMSCALSQRMSPQTKLRHRLAVGFGITDEIFAITVARPGMIEPFYTYGAFAVASPMWAGGTALGAIAGNLLPLRLVSAFSVALYGMFLAVIIPPARKDKIIAGIIAVSFVASLAALNLPFISQMSEGTRTILLTVVISAVAAIFFPKNDENDESEESRAREA